MRAQGRPANVSFTLSELLELRSHFSPNQFTNHVWIARKLDATIRDNFSPAMIDACRSQRDTMRNAEF